jgi:O-acetylserine/cysteine efflux transporter
VIGVDRAASAPVVPLLLILAAAATWGVTNVITRVAQPPDPLAMLVWASLVAPLPLLGLSFLFEGSAEMGDALAGIDVAGLAALAFVSLLSGCSGSRPGPPAQAPHRGVRHAVRAAGAGVRIASAALFLGTPPSPLELGGAVPNLRRARRHAQAGAQAGGRCRRCDRARLRV